MIDKDIPTWYHVMYQTVCYVQNYAFHMIITIWTITVLGSIMWIWQNDLHIKSTILELVAVFMYKTCIINFWFPINNIFGQNIWYVAEPVGIGLTMFWFDLQIYYEKQWRIWVIESKLNTTILTAKDKKQTSNRCSTLYTIDSWYFLIQSKFDIHNI